MVGKNTKNRSPLLPDRHPIQDFFICDVTDAIPKDDMGSMEHPIFSLATKPDLTIREYEHNGSKIAIVPSTLGLATIHDKDILIYCISQLIAKMKTGAAPGRTLHIKAHDLLVSTNRNIDGRGYEQLIAALERLRGTSIKTNIKTGGIESTSGFGLIDSWNVMRHTDSGRMSEMRVNLSDWVSSTIGRATKSRSMRSRGLRFELSWCRRTRAAGEGAESAVSRRSGEYRSEKAHTFFMEIS